MALTASRPFKPFAIISPDGTTVGIRLLEIPTEARTMGGRPAVWLKGPKKCLELGVCLRQYFAPLGGKKENN